MRLIPLLSGLTVLTAASAAFPQEVGRSGGEPAATQTPAALNHVYVVVDATTFAAIRDNAALARLLGRTDGGLPDYAPPEPDADRVFFRGRETYLEIFAPNNRFNEPVGKVGIALGHDDPAAFDGLKAAWRETCPAGLRHTSVTYRRVDPPVPWYDAVQCDETASGAHLAVWAMVYLPHFHDWQTGSATEAFRTSRADILASRAVDGQGRFDIKHVSLQVTAETFGRLAEQLANAGFDRQDASDGATFKGAGWTLELHLGQPRLRAIELSTCTDLARPLPLGTGTLLPITTGQVRWLP